MMNTCNHLMNNFAVLYWIGRGIERCTGLWRAGRRAPRVCARAAGGLPPGRRRRPRVSRSSRPRPPSCSWRSWRADTRPPRRRPRAPPDAAPSHLRAQPQARLHYTLNTKAKQSKAKRRNASASTQCIGVALVSSLLFSAEPSHSDSGFKDDIRDVYIDTHWAHALCKQKPDTSKSLTRNVQRTLEMTHKSQLTTRFD